MSHPHPLEQIRGALPSLSPALAAAADWVMRNAAQAATLGIEDIATASGSSPASVNRLARAAGYSGFTELKAELARVLREAIDPVHKLRASRARGALGEDGDLEPPADHVRIAQASLEQVVRDNSAAAYADVAARVLAARRVYVLAFGLTTHFGQWLADALSPYVNAAFGLGVAGGTEQSANRLAGTNADDVLIALTLPRYSRDTVALADVARERGAYVVAITDAASAPIAVHAHGLLIAPCSHPVLSSSCVALQLVCEVLVGEVMRRHPQADRVAADLTDSVLPHLTFPSPVRERGTPPRGPA